MTIYLQLPDVGELRPRLMVLGVGGAGGNAVNNMISAGLQGVDFVVANTDAQALRNSRAPRVIQMGTHVTEGLGAGSHPEVGRAAAEESAAEISDHLSGSHMVFITAGMGGGTGTGAAPVIARMAKDMGILTVGVVTKPFHFEGIKRMRRAEEGILSLQDHVDTLLVIPNQNLFRVANDKTTFADAFAMADQVLYSGVACITDLMVKEGLINLDFADVRSVMREMGKAMMGTGEASGEARAQRAAEAAISNPLLDDVSMRGARGLLISVTGGRDMTLFELDEAATLIREQVDGDANIIVGATYDDALEGIIRVSVVATGIDAAALEAAPMIDTRTTSAKVWTRPIVTPVATAPQPAPVAVATPQPSYSEPVQSQPVQQPPAQTFDNDITIRQVLPPTPQLTLTQPEPMADEFALEAFIPPVPEMPERRPPRMPSIDELPPIAQEQIRAAQAPEGADADKRGGLMHRLAALGGFARKREDESELQAPAHHTAPMAADYAPLPAARRAQREAPALRPSQRLSEEDQLEIPAFLRRKGG